MNSSNISQSVHICTPFSSLLDIGSPCSLAGPLYVMIPPSSSAEILQAMGQSRPIAPKGVPTLLVQNRLISDDIYSSLSHAKSIERKKGNGGEHGDIVVSVCGGGGSLPAPLAVCG